MNKIKIMLVDDHRVVLDGIKVLLMDAENIEIIDEAGSGKDLFTKLENNRPDILILDVSLPGESGIDITKQLKITYPDINVIIFSGNINEDVIADAFEAGALGILQKSASRSEIIEAIYAVNDGQEYLGKTISLSLIKNFINKEKPKEKYEQQGHLSPREIEIIKYLAEGLQFKEIGARMNISARTVETHKNNILHKLELNTIIDIVKYAIKHNIVQL